MIKVREKLEKIQPK